MTAVLVHGNPETAAIWGPLTEALAARGVDDVVALTPPGFGAAPPRGWQPTRAAYVGWLATELERLAGPVDLVGHDWGAGHVYGLLCDPPAKVRSWAADCAGLLHPDYVWHDNAQLWQQPGVGEEAIGQMADLGVEGRTAAYGGLGLPPEEARSLATAFDEEMGRCILGLYRDAAQPAMAELGDRVAAAACPPGLVIDPTDDPYLPTALARPVAERLRAEVLTLPGRGHWWMFDDVDPIADALIDFWRRTA